MASSSPSPEGRYWRARLAARTAAVLSVVFGLCTIAIFVFGDGPGWALPGLVTIGCAVGWAMQADRARSAARDLPKQ